MPDITEHRRPARSVSKSSHSGQAVKNKASGTKTKKKKKEPQKSILSPSGKLQMIMVLIAVMLLSLISLGSVSQRNSANGSVVAVSSTDSTSYQRKTTEATTLPSYTTPSLAAAGSLTMPDKAYHHNSDALTVASQTTTTTQPKPVRKYFLTVTSDTANLRTGAGTDFNLVKKAKKGDEFSLISIEYSESGSLWYKVFADDVSDEEAYINGNYIRYTGPIPDGKVYLTFDDGPSSQTSKILDILDKYNAKATFFVIHSSKYSDLYSEIARRGHTVALHSYTHDYKKIYSSETAYFNDLTKLSDYVYEQSGIRSHYIRFPGGGSNTVSRKYCRGIMSQLSQEVERRGYKYYDWNVSSGDAEGNHIAPDKIFNTTKRESGNRPSIMLLMHDAEAKDTTVEALPKIIEYYQSRGYQLLPITDETEEPHHKVNN